jgi:hypothetical protein
LERLCVSDRLGGALAVEEANGEQVGIRDVEHL